MPHTTSQQGQTQQVNIIIDPVAPGGAAEREVGFSIPDQYNASRILFDNLTRGNGERIAVWSSFGNLTYAQLAAQACRAGNLLLSLGATRGERVLLLLNDTPAYPAFLYGAIRAGLVPVLLNTLTPPDLVQFYLQDAGAKIIVVDSSISSLISPEATNDTALNTLISINGAAHVSHVATIDFDEIAKDLSPDLDEADTHKNEMAFWMYSSGSTGRPKGIVHLQHDMAYTIATYSNEILKLKPDDICFSVPKIFFAYGCGNSVVFPFAVGASTALLAGRPDAKAIFETIEAFRPTVFFGVPTVYTTLTKAQDAAHADLSSLRLCLSAAEVLSADVFNAWKNKTGLEIIEGLGSTEVLHIYLSNTASDKRLGSAGKRVPGYDVKLVDRDGHDIGDAEEGIMWVRGQSNTPFYWNKPDKTADTMRGDWINTNDRFAVDKDGFYYFRGRADDFIKISGQWVYPLEVELCLANHPAVHEVAVLAFELPDRRMTLKAFVVRMDSAQAMSESELRKVLQDYVKTTLMPHKYPREVEFVESLPKTGTNKIDRQELFKRGLSRQD